MQTTDERSQNAMAIAQPDGTPIQFDLIPRELIDGDEAYESIESIRKGVVGYEVVTDSVHWVYKKIINGCYPSFPSREALGQLVSGTGYYDIDFATIAGHTIACFHIKPSAINSMLIGATEIGYRNRDGYVAYRLHNGSIGYFMHRAASVYQGFWFESITSFQLYHDRIFRF